MFGNYPQRSERKTVTLTKKEAEKVEELAIEKKVSISAFIRSAIKEKINE